MYQIDSFESSYFNTLEQNYERISKYRMETILARRLSQMDLKLKQSL